MNNYTKASNYNSKESSKPEFTNEERTAAWINQDKNGNAYLRIKLPFGLDGICLFPSNDELKEVFNQVYEEVN